MQYVKVLTPDGAGVHAREAPKDSAIWKYTAPDGTVLPVVSMSGDYYKVMYKGKGRYVSRFYVQECAADGGRVAPQAQVTSAADGGGFDDLAALDQRVAELERLAAEQSERISALEGRVNADNRLPNKQMEGSI